MDPLLNAARRAAAQDWELAAADAAAAVQLDVDCAAGYRQKAAAEMELGASPLALQLQYSLWRTPAAAVGE